MHLLNEKQLHEIEQIINDIYNAMTVVVLGPGFFEDSEVDRLMRLGLLREEDIQNYPETAYLFGRLFSDIGEDNAKTLSMENFEDYARRAAPTLSGAHRAAVAQARRQTYSHIKGLRNRVTTKINQVILEADGDMQHRIEQELREQVSAGLEKVQAARDVARAVGKATGDWTKDWDKIVVAEMNNAFLLGRADEISRRSVNGKDAKVFKKPRPDACSWCNFLYLAKDGITPKVFNLREMRAHGTNVGLAKKEWKPVLKSPHPNCRCTLHELPPGFGFDAEGRMIYLHGIGPGTARPDVTRITYEET